MEKSCETCKHKAGEYLCDAGEVCRRAYGGHEHAESFKLHDLLEPQNADNVNHPKHYETGKFECIDVMIETQGVEAVKHFCICNAFKYLYRHNGKNGVEDIKKARWYIDKYLELEGESHE